MPLQDCDNQDMAKAFAPLSALRSHYATIQEFFNEAGMARIDAQRSRLGLPTSLQERGFGGRAHKADVPESAEDHLL